MAHDAFISYSRKDKDFAIPLHKALSNYLPPKDPSLPRRRLNVFRDAEDFTGAEYYQALDRHLNDTAKLIVICSPAARASQFVNDEIQRFARAKGPEHIVALLIDGIPNNEAKPDQQAQMAFPDALCEVMKMPLAADYRGFDPKRSRVDRGAYEASWYTTLANILGVSRAQIEQREKKRRMRRRQIIAGVTSVPVLVVAYLLFNVWKGRQDVIREQNVAAARALAGQAEAIANGSTPLGEGLRQRALIAAESLRMVWTAEGYMSWRRATLQMPPILSRIDTHSILVRMAFTADGKRLFALCGEQHIHVFSVPELEELKKFQALDPAFELAVDAKGEHALTYVANDAGLQVFDVRSGAKRDISLPANFHSASFNPSGEAIMVSLTDLWALDETSDVVHPRITFPKGTVTVTLGPDGATALAVTDGNLFAYDTVTGKVRWNRSLKKGIDHDVVFRGDSRFALIKRQGEITILNATTGEAVRTLPVSPDARGRAMLLSDERYVIHRDVYPMSPDPILTLPLSDKPARLAAFPVASPSGRFVAGNHTDNDSDFAVIDVTRLHTSIADDLVTWYLTLPEGHEGRSAAFTADGFVLALGSGPTGNVSNQTSELQLVSLKPARWRGIVPSRSRTGDLNVLPPDSHVMFKSDVSQEVRTFDADGIRIADDSLGTYVSPSGRLAARHEAGKGWIVTDTVDGRHIALPESDSPLEYSPDEKRVLLSPNIYSLKEPAIPQRVADARPWQQAWSFPGSKLVIGTDDDSVGMSDSRRSVLFDWETGKVSAGPASVNSIYAVSPDGQHFITYGENVMNLWKAGDAKPEVQSGRIVLDYNTPVYFSPDGKWLAASKCGEVPVYDASTLALRFEVPIGPACLAGLTLDGNYVVSRAAHTGGPEPTLHPVTLAGVLEETCSKVLDNLTARESQTLRVAALKTCPDRGAKAAGSTPPSAN